MGDYISRSELFNRLAYVQLTTDARTIIYTILQGMHGIEIPEADIKKAETASAASEAVPTIEIDR